MFDRTALLALVERFPRQRIIMLGDLVADQSIFGEIARVSREAPVLILKERERQVVPGGGANAANNLAALGARVSPVGWSATMNRATRCCTISAKDIFPRGTSFACRIT